MACEVCKKPYVHSTEFSAFDSDEKPHVCVTCGKSFSLKIQLKKHMETHEDGKPYVCYSCEKKSSLTYNLRLQKKANFSCGQCNKTFESKRMLLQHASEHNLVDSDECEEGFKNVSDLKKHSVIHKATKNQNKKQKVNIEKPYQCNECEKSFSQLSAFTKHSVSHTRYQCGLCKAQFCLQRELDKHFLNECNTKTSDEDAKKYVCSICNKTFARKTALDGHIIAHVSEKSESAPEDDSDADVDFSCNLPSEKNNQLKETCRPKLKLRRSYACEICKKVCATEVLLQKHMLFHKKIKKEPNSYKKKYRCRVCKEVFLTKIHYKQHKVSHGLKGKPKNDVKKVKTYMCDICCTDFTKKKHLKKHKKSHSSTIQSHNTNSMNSNESQQKITKRSKNFACGICGKRFAGAICLRKHELRHKDESYDVIKTKKNRTPVSLICPFCNEDFTSRKFSFMRHKLTHTPEICGICDERFVDRAALREHLKTHIGTEEARKFLECSNKAQSLKTNLQNQEGKVEYIYLVLR